MSTFSGRASKWMNGAPRRRDAVLATLTGLAVRLLTATWGAGRFPPAEDGRFYYVLATRLARGLGYTWAWPDGAVTYAAHYPVGYPGMLAVLFSLIGDRPGAAMTLNALLGAVAVFAVHRAAATSASRGGALLAAAAVALHPGLTFYTPALMTEGVTAALLAVLGWLVCRAQVSGERPSAHVLAIGLVLGVSTLVRPQSLLLAPLFGALCVRSPGARKRAAMAAIVTAISVAVCAPWTIRNCRRMSACVLVSANAGWNLFIGAAPRATGAWVSLERLGVPPDCATVWGEADKDRCFETAGLRAIRAEPLRWALLIPKKLATTFDYAGAAGWYLHSSNPVAFDDHAKTVLGTVETIWQRLVVLLALWAVATLPGPRSSLRRTTGAAAALALFTRSGWVSHLGIVAAAGLLGTRLARLPLVATSVSVLASTMAAHAVFFGAGRYSLVCFPALSALAGSVLTPKQSPGDTGDSG